MTVDIQEDIDLHMDSGRLAVASLPASELASLESVEEWAGTELLVVAVALLVGILVGSYSCTMEDIAELMAE